MKDSDYITILSPMVSKLNLSGNNLIVFALIHGFTKDGEHEFTGSIEYISKWTNISRQSVILTLKALTDAGFINKKDEIINGVKFCKYTTNYEDLISSQKIIPPIKKVKKGSQKSLLGGSQKSLPNNDNKDNNKYNDINIPPTPPKGDKKEESIQKRAKGLFEQYYMYVCHIPYYWSAKDAGNMKQILNKLKFQREQKNLSTDDDSVIYALQYLLQSINDRWVKDNLSVSIINSKFNELINQAKNGTTKPNDSQEGRRTSVRNLKEMSAAILQQLAGENG